MPFALRAGQPASMLAFSKSLSASLLKKHPARLSRSPPWTAHTLSNPVPSKTTVTALARVENLHRGKHTDKYRKLQTNTEKHRQIRRAQALSERLGSNCSHSRLSCLSPTCCHLRHPEQLASPHMELGRDLGRPAASASTGRMRALGRPTAAASTGRIEAAVAGQGSASHEEGRVRVDMAALKLRVEECNYNLEKAAEFLPFYVGLEVLGYVHPRFAEHLKRFPEVFVVQGGEGGAGGGGPEVAGGEGRGVHLGGGLRTPEERSVAVAGALAVLRDEGRIRGWRDELFPVSREFGSEPLLVIERAAAPLFGVEAYGVHMNGYVVSENGAKALWVARRSPEKQTFPNRLDHLVAGGQPVGLTCRDNLIKECQEEAGIPAELAKRAVAVGAVSYQYVNGEELKRDVLFTYDLELPAEFRPQNTDGEVASFQLLPVEKVVEIIQQTTEYKPNCALVVIDFLFRHGYITPEDPGYLQLLRGLLR